MAQAIHLNARDSFNLKEQLKGVSENSTTEFIVFPNIDDSNLDSANLSENESELNKYRTLSKSIVAFLNREGGRIYIGINKKTKTVVGVSDSASDYIKDAINLLLKEISPNPNWLDKKVKIEFLPISDTDNFVVKVLVKRGEQRMIYSTKSNAFNFFWRNEENNESYTLDQYRSEFEKRIQGEFAPKEIPFPDWEGIYQGEPVDKLEKPLLIRDSKPEEIQKQPSNFDYKKENPLREAQVEVLDVNNRAEEEQKRDNVDEKEAREESKKDKEEVNDNDEYELAIPSLSVEENNKIEGQKELPITSYKDKILKTVSNFPITLVKGRTGSGKTTQIPQYLAKAYKGKIALAQPFKESLPSIAERLKEEYGEKPDIVSTLSDEKASQYNSKIRLMTHEALIYQLLFNPDLQEYSCIIVDEAHERFIDTEALIIFVRYLFREKLIPDIKIVIASATLNLKFFEKFLKEEEIRFDIIDIPGTQYPVKEHWRICKFIPKQQTRPRIKKRNQYEEDEQLVEDIHMGGEQPSAEFAKGGCMPLENHKPDKAIEIIKKLIEEGYQKLTGHVLVFVPTADDTRDLSIHFKKIKKIDKIFDIMPFHGNLTVENAQKVFMEPAEGKKYKLIFSTQIGQTAITISDLFAVIDSGWDVVRKYDRKTESTLGEFEFISQSQSTQRRGRVGRTCPGHFLPLYSLKDFEEMQKFQVSVMEKFNLQKPILWILRTKRNAFTMKFLEKCTDAERKHVENLLHRMNPGLIRQFKERSNQDISQRVRSLNMTISDDEELFSTLLSKNLKHTGIAPLPKEIQRRFKKLFEEAMSDIEKKDIYLTNFKWLEKVSDQFKDNLIKDTQFLMNYGLVKFLDIEAKFNNLKFCVLTELGSFASEKDIFPNQIKTFYESIVYDCTEKVCRAMSILESDWKLFETRTKSLKAIKAQWNENSEISDFNVYLQISEAYEEQINICLFKWAKELSLTEDQLDELYENSIHFSDFKDKVKNELLKIMKKEDLDKKFETFHAESEKYLEMWAEEYCLSKNALDLAQIKLKFYINLIEQMTNRLTLPENECEVTVGVRNIDNQKISIHLISEFGQNNIEILRGEIYDYKLKLRIGSKDDLDKQTLKIVTRFGDHLTEQKQQVEEISLDRKNLTIEHGNAIFSFNFSIGPFLDFPENHLKCFFFGYVTNTAIQKCPGQNIFEILRLGYGTRVDKASNELKLEDKITTLNMKDNILKIIISPQTRGTPNEDKIFTSYSFKGQYASCVDEQWFYELQEPGANYRRYLEKAKEKPNDGLLKDTPQRGSGIVRNQAKARKEETAPRLEAVNRNSGGNNRPQGEGIIKRSDKKSL